MSTTSFRRHHQVSLDAAIHRVYVKFSHRVRVLDAFTDLLCAVRARSNLMEAAPVRDGGMLRFVQLDAAVASLSPADQLLVTLRYQDNRSAREIASLMSLPTPFHVYRRLNRVHESLRRMLLAPADRERSVDGAAHEAPAVQYIGER